MVVLKIFLMADLGSGFLAAAALAENDPQIPDVCYEARELEAEIKAGNQGRDLALEVLEKANACTDQFHQSPPDLYAKLQLEQNFGLDETSSPEDYKSAVKVIKSAAKVETGTTQVYIPAFGNVPATIMTVKIGPSSPGNPEAQYLLGYIYLNGLTGKVKASKAKRWLERAASQGHFQARQMLEEIENKD